MAHSSTSGVLVLTSIDSAREFLQTVVTSRQSAPIHTLRIDTDSDRTVDRDGGDVEQHGDEMEELLAKITDLDFVQVQNLEQIILDFPLPIHALSKVPPHAWNTLESLSIQYKISSTALLPPTETIKSQVQSFSTSLLSVFRNMPNLKQLRLSLPHSFTAPYSYFLDNFIPAALANPEIFPKIEVVDVTHSGPRYDVILGIIKAHKGSLRHLILDQGIEFNMPDSGERIGGSDSEDEEQDVPASADPLFFTWAGVGRTISSLRKELGPQGFPLQSICAAKCEVTMFEEALMPSPVDREQLLEMMRFNPQGQDSDAVDLDGLVVCTAWPGKDEQHSEGCGHLNGWGEAFGPKNIWEPLTRTQMDMGDMQRNDGHTTL